MDDEKRMLERDAEHDPAALRQLQALNDRTGLSVADAEYLAEYLALCEEAVEKGYPETDALYALAQLNLRYQTRVGSKTLKREVATMKARKVGWDEGYDEGRDWASSNC